MTVTLPGRCPALLIIIATMVIALPGFAAEPAQVQRILAEAEASLATARQAGNAWSSTEKLLAAARDTLAQGDTERAGELAHRALLTADMAQQQARLESNTWQARVPTP